MAHKFASRPVFDGGGWRIYDSIDFSRLPEGQRVEPFPGNEDLRDPVLTSLTETQTMSFQKANIESLKVKALQFRKEILETIYSSGSGHPGGSLSAVEIFIALYYYKLRHQPQNPAWQDRDRFIISKGHCSPVAYVTLANCGYFPKEELKTFRKNETRLQGHVHSKVPGIEFNTGSLGHGLSVANGMAIGAKILKKDFRVYCLMGDGEIQEGSVWEAAMTAAHYQLDNLCAIVDYNKIQENGLVRKIKNLEPLKDKWTSFGWQVFEVDGHDLKELIKTLDRFDSVQKKPTMIIAHTIKGKGISFMEGNKNWHGKAPNADQFHQALDELQKGNVL